MKGMEKKVEVFPEEWGEEWEEVWVHEAEDVELMNKK